MAITSSCGGRRRCCHTSRNGRERFTDHRIIVVCISIDGGALSKGARQIRDSLLAFVSNIDDRVRPRVGIDPLLLIGRFDRRIVTIELRR